MSSNVQDDLSLPTFGDTSSSSESARFEPESLKIAGGEKADKEERELVISAKATVEEKPVIGIRASIQRRAALNKPKKKGTTGYCTEKNG